MKTPTRPNSTPKKALAAAVMAIAASVSAAQAPTGSTAPKAAPAESISYSGPAVETYDDSVWGDYPPRVGLQYYTGDGLGYRDGYTTFDLFVPLVTNPGQSLTFLDSRIILSNNSSLGFNIGAGYRTYSPTTNSVLGAYIYYDNRDTERFTFNQVTFGFESLWACADWRANVYIPFGDDRKLIAAGFATEFRDNHLILQSNSLWEAAMTGIDTEVGGALPWLGRYGVWGYIGGYLFGAEKSDDALGFSSRLEIRAFDNLRFHVSVTNDQVFDTNWVFGVTGTFPGMRSTADCLRGTATDRFVEPVHRLYNIVVDEQYVSEEAVAINPATGSAYNFIHVDAAATGLGTIPDADGNLLSVGPGFVQTPVRNLEDAQRISGANDIIYVHGGSYTPTAPVVLLDGQKLLGEGVVHVLPTQLGDAILPGVNDAGPLASLNFSNVGPNLPGIVLANGNEVAGLRIINTSGDGIVGLGVNNAVIRDNILSSIGNNDPLLPANGILLVNSTGSVVLRANDISGVDLDGIRILNATGSINATIQDNVVTNVGGVGIRMVQVPPGVINATLINNNATVVGP